MAESEPGAARSDDLALMLDAAGRAGDIAMRYFRQPNEVWLKGGRSPVSQADLAVDAFLREALTSARPHYGWLSEESADAGDRLRLEQVFVVDPIDGTRGFLEGDAQWCLSLALVRAGRPVCAVLHCPALQRTYSAVEGLGATLNGARIAPAASSEIVRVAGTRRLGEEIERAFPGRFVTAPYVPSLACRLAMVAAGDIDACFVRGGAHDWDLAAADLIVSEAGGRVSTLDDRPLRYDDPTTGNPALVASGPGRHAGLLHLAKTGRFLH